VTVIVCDGALHVFVPTPPQSPIQHGLTERAVFAFSSPVRCDIILLMLSALLVLATAAATPDTRSPKVAIDLGVLGGTGNEGDSEYDHFFKSWRRVGPELTIGIFPVEWFVVGLGVGYQAGYYAPFNTRRHELSARGIARFRLLETSRFDGWLGASLMYTRSMKAEDSTAYVGYYGQKYLSDHVRYTLSIDVATSLRLTETIYLSAELMGGLGYKQTSELQLNAELIGRIGTELRF
jgi:hypothetical protein